MNNDDEGVTVIVYESVSASLFELSFPTLAEYKPPGATTLTTSQVFGSVPVPVIMVCLPFTMPEGEVPIGQQFPIWPCQPVSVPDSKSELGQEL